MTKETKFIQINPSETEMTIELWENFGWELVDKPQEIFNRTKDSYQKSFGDSIYSVTETETINYVTITFRRDRNMPNYAELVDLEHKYFYLKERCNNITIGCGPCRPERDSFKWGILIAIGGFIAMWAKAEWGIIPLLPGFLIIIWKFIVRFIELKNWRHERVEWEYESDKKREEKSKIINEKNMILKNAKNLLQYGASAANIPLQTREKAPIQMSTAQTESFQPQVLSEVSSYKPNLNAVTAKEPERPARSDDKQFPAKKSKNKVAVIAIITAICIAAAMAYSVIQAVQTPSNISWYTANPKAANFTISTAEELAGLAQIVNGTLENKIGRNPINKIIAPLVQIVNKTSGQKLERDNFTGKTITLAGNIDLSQYNNWVPIGNFTYDTLSKFSGTFDGGGYVINNLTINRPGTDRQGLFGAVVEGNVKNLGLDDVKIHGRNRVGSIAGTVQNSSITNSYFGGAVKGDSLVGGLAGLIRDNGSVTNSYSTGAVSGNGFVGGVAGFIRDASSVINSYSTGIVVGRDNVGGVVGFIRNNGRVTTSYSAGAINGVSNIGGVAGHISNNSSVANSYSAGAVSGNDFIGGVAGFVRDTSSVNNSYSISMVNSTGNFAGGIAGSIDKRSRVANSVALNPVVNGIGTDVGRVVGGFSASVLSNNAAFAGMKNNADELEWLNKGAAAADGADIISIVRDGTIAGRFTIANGWTLQHGSLPGIGKLVAIPSHLLADADSIRAELIRLEEARMRNVPEFTDVAN